MIQTALIEHIATFDGHLNGDISRPMHCGVGDEDYTALVERIKQKWEGRISIEAAIYQERIEKLSPNDFEDIIRLANEALNLQRSEGIDYNLYIKEDGQNTINQSNGIVSLEGLPCTVSDNHALAYQAILDILNQTDESITLLRFDRHSDCGDLSDRVKCDNYITYLLTEVPERFKEIITLNGGCNFLNGNEMPPDPRFINSHASQKFYEVPFLSGSIKNFKGKIKGPVILDIDMDGIEKSYWNLDRGLIGGRFRDCSTSNGVHRYNQEDMLMHPFTAAIGLRGIIEEQPMAVLIHTERSYRNRYFHNQIEYDFLRALAVDNVSKLS